MACDPKDWRRSSQSSQDKKQKAGMAGLCLFIVWCPGEDSNLHAAKR